MIAARLVIDATLLADLLRELERRGDGRRESGAFLLTDRDQPAGGMPQPVTGIAFYDDLDPNCLTGGIDFTAVGYSALNAVCRRDGRRVVADIHTHPHRHVRQSRIDATHPMVALDGHIALIAPYYAAGVTDLTELGVHVRDHGQWESVYDADTATVVLIRPASSARSRTPWWRARLTRMRRHRLEHR